MIAWCLAFLSPFLFCWIPSFAFFGKAATGDLPGAIAQPLFAIAPSLIVAAFIHTKKKTDQATEEIRRKAMITAITVSFSVLVALYVGFWFSVFNSIGVNFGAVFTVMLSPLWIYSVTAFAYHIGKRC